jgi:hypothetical protein
MPSPPIAIKHEMKTDTDGADAHAAPATKRAARTV